MTSRLRVQLAITNISASSGARCCYHEECVLSSSLALRALSRDGLRALVEQHPAVFGDSAWVLSPQTIRPELGDEAQSGKRHC